MANVLVTGSDGGIGTVISSLLRQAGHSVVGVTKQDADLSSPADIQNLKEKIVSAGQRIDWIVCAHGFIDTEIILENQSPENIEATFTINTLSIVYIAQQFLPHIPEGGGIISLSSSAGIQASGRFSVYSASKAAVNNFMQALARNRPEQKFYAVCPGPTNTTMRERIAGDASRMQDPEVVAQLIVSLIENSTEYKSGDAILIKDGVVSISARV